MTNKGADPIDPATLVGQVRALVGDINSKLLDPIETGFVDYTYFADSELQAYLTASADSTTRAVGFALLGLARDFAMTGRSVKTDDLALSNIQRSGDLRQVAAEWFAQADAEERKVDSSFFEIVPFAGRAYTVY